MAFGDGKSFSLRTLKSKMNFSGRAKGFVKNTKQTKQNQKNEKIGIQESRCVCLLCGLHFQNQLKARRIPRRWQIWVGGGAPGGRRTWEAEGNGPKCLQNPGPARNARPCKLALFFRPPAPTRELCKFSSYLHTLIHLRPG